MDNVARQPNYGDTVLFEADTAVLIVAISAIIGTFVAAGVLLGRRMRATSAGDHQRESLGVVQGALLGLVGLLLAFGLTMAVTRYEVRRDVLVEEANAIGTTYLRAQLLAEPERSQSMDVLREYTDAAIAMNESPPDSQDFDAAVKTMDGLHNDLWRLAGVAISKAPQDSAPRLYIETLNDTIDRHADRVASLRNRVPSAVWILQILGSAVALGVLSLYLSILGRGILTPLLAGVFVILILFNSFDLDRPRRGFIHVPSAALTDVRATMDLPPAASPP